MIVDRGNFDFRDEFHFSRTSKVESLELESITINSILSTGYS